MEPVRAATRYLRRSHTWGISCRPQDPQPEDRLGTHWAYIKATVTSSPSVGRCALQGGQGGVPVQQAAHPTLRMGLIQPPPTPLIHQPPSGPCVVPGWAPGLLMGLQWQ